jgi:AbrB family looped-hinge helix DNA binding protein
MAATAKITSKGQITIPAEVRRELGVRSGDKIDFVRNGAGRYELAVRSGRLADLRGIFRDVGPVEPEEIAAWVAEARAAMATDSE